MFLYGKDDFLFFLYVRIMVMWFVIKEKILIICFIVILYNFIKYVVYLDIKMMLKFLIFIL